VRGARAVQRAILSDFPDADINVSIVWINMLPLDSPVAAKLSARIIHDLRACHFHDPAKLAGKAIAQSLGGQDKAAWDIYLFYEAGNEWSDSPPAPIYWAHQLQGSTWADSAHYHSGDDLLRELHKIMQDLTSARS
jgi:hypothetical protein